MKVRYLVTGGAGFIGSNLVLALTSQGERVRVLDSLKYGSFSTILEQPNGHLVEPIIGDIRDSRVVVDSMKGIDVVFHFAAQVSVPESVRNPIETDQINSQGTLTVLESAKQNNVRRVIFAASSAAYGNNAISPKHEDILPRPNSPYGVSKLAGEYHMAVYAANFGIETISLRFFNVFGPFQSPFGAYAAAIPKFLWAAIQKKAIPIFGDGKQTRDFVFIDNVVAANLLAASTSEKLSGDVVNVASGESIELNDVIEFIRTNLFKDIEIEYLPERHGDIKHSSADISKIHKLLNYSPIVPWRKGLLPTCEYLTRLSVTPSIRDN
jgi:UDP-glucose 4-epimerase